MELGLGGPEEVVVAVGGGVLDFGFDEGEVALDLGGDLGGVGLVAGDSVGGAEFEGVGAGGFDVAEDGDDLGAGHGGELDPGIGEGIGVAEELGLGGLGAGPADVAGDHEDHAGFEDAGGFHD